MVMGNSKSRQVAAAFGKELETLNKIVTDIIVGNPNTGHELKDKRFSLGNPTECGKYTTVLESQLKKHLKIELKELKDSIYLVPSSDSLKMQNEQFMNKDSICKLIATHYEKIMKLLLIIKYVYDVEGTGSASLAGITLDNVRLDGNMFVIQYCTTPQQQTVLANQSSMPEQKDPDFAASLRGFKYYCDYLLSETEKVNLLKNLRLLFSNTPKKHLARYLFCGDSFLTGESYKDIFSPLELKNSVKCDPRMAERFVEFINTHTENTMINIAPYNFVLHEGMCLDKKTIVRDLTANTPENKKVRKLHDRMKADYIKNLNAVINIAKRVVVADGAGNFTLQNIDSEVLEQVTKEVKQTIARFYIQSIINFHALFKYVKSLKDNIISVQPLENYGKPRRSGTGRKLGKH